MTESELPDPTESRVSLDMSKAMQFAFAVILGIAALSDFEFWMKQPDGAHQGFAFDGWRAPEIDPIGDSFELQAMDLKVSVPEGFRFYHVRSSQTPKRQSVAFVNSTSRLMGSIRLFDSESGDWDPDRLSLGDAPSLSNEDLLELIASLETAYATEDATVEQERRGFPFDADPFAPRIRGVSVDYSGYRCLWMTPRKSLAWPSRVHFGRFESENHPTLLVRLYELSASTETPSYDSGAFAALGNALIPRS